MKLLQVAVVILAACHHAPADPGGVSDPIARFRDAGGGARWRDVQVVETNARISIGGLTGTSDTVEDVVTGRHRNTLHLGAIVAGDGYDTAPWELSANGEVVEPNAPDRLAQAVTNRWMTRRGFSSRTGARYVDRGVEAGLRHLEATPDGGAPIELWFDDKTGLLAKTREREGEDITTTTYTDYRDVQGLAFAHRVEIDTGDPRNRATLEITSIHLRNAVENDAAFARPKTDAERLTFTAPSSDIPFELINNHIYIRGLIDDQPVRLIVDTGGLNLLVPAAAARLGIHAEGKLAVGGVGETKADLALARGKSLVVGGVQLADPVFYVVDMGELVDIEGEAFDGLVGFELFQRLGVRIDYPRTTLTLTKHDAFTPPAGAIAVPLEMADRMPIVAGAIDGIPARFTIDTGARNSITTNGPFTKEHGLEARYHPKFETVTGWGVGGRATGKPVRFAKIELGGAAVADVLGDLFTGTAGAHADPSIAANVGGGILRRFVVTFDYEGKKMYLEPRPAPREIYDRAGMFYLGTPDGGLRILAVTPGGPAARAGLAADDKIVSIDGQPVSAKRIGAWRAVLSGGAVGTKHALDVAGRGTKTLELAELVP